MNNEMTKKENYIYKTEVQKRVIIIAIIIPLITVDLTGLIFWLSKKPISPFFMLAIVNPIIYMFFGYKYRRVLKNIGFKYIALGHLFIMVTGFFIFYGGFITMLFAPLYILAEWWMHFIFLKIEEWEREYDRQHGY